MIARGLIALIRLYQAGVAPLLGPCCRFYPSCSQYMVDAITRKGVARGVLKGTMRVCRCHPYNPGGYDPVE